MSRKAEVIIDRAGKISNNDTVDIRQCPFCGGFNLTWAWESSGGHGDRGYEDLRVICRDCVATQGLSNYGEPGKSDRIKAVEAWNQRKHIK